MDSKLGVLQVERVANGWVIRGYSYNHFREGGYLPEGTHVARTPGELGDMIAQWAKEQQQG